MRDGADVDGIPDGDSFTVKTKHVEILSNIRSLVNYLSQFLIEWGF